MKKFKTKVKKKDFWKCVRCNATSKSKGTMIPCPRGGCEAEVCGEIIVTTEIRLFEEASDDSK